MPTVTTRPSTSGPTLHLALDLGNTTWKLVFASGGARQRRVGIVAVARKLLIALWRYLHTGVLPEGALLKP